MPGVWPLRYRKLQAVLAIAALAALCLSCRRTGVVGPTPATIPTPGPVLPTPKLGILAPLTTNGNLFAVELRGLVICCYDGDGDEQAYTLPSGWPLITTDALKEIAYNGGNWTHIRVTTEQDGLSWPAWLGKAGQSIEAARDLGVYVEVTVLDIWGLINADRGYWPWRGEDCGITQESPRNRHVLRVRDIVRATGKFPNVLYEIGNEAFRCDVSREWETGIRDAIRNAEREFGYVRHPIGTNSHDTSLEREFDYSTWHGKDAIDAGPVPRLVNETNDRETSAENYEQAMKDACAQGTYFGLWRGRMRNSEWDKALKVMREFKCTR